MKARVVNSIAVVFGCVIAYWLFALAFTRNIQQFNQAAIIPVLACFLGALILTAVHPAATKGSALRIMGPTVVINSLFFLTVLAEGRGPEWTHLTTALKVVVAVIVGAAGGFLINRLFQRKHEG